MTSSNINKSIEIDATDIESGCGLYRRTGNATVYTAIVDNPLYGQVKLVFTLHEKEQFSGNHRRMLSTWKVGKLINAVWKIRITDTEEDDGESTCRCLYRILSISDNNELELKPVGAYHADEVEMIILEPFKG